MFFEKLNKTDTVYCCDSNNYYYLDKEFSIFLVGTAAYCITQYTTSDTNKKIKQKLLAININ